MFCAVLLVAPVALVSAQTVALNANFNQNTVGEQPPADLPGDPVGDFLAFGSNAAGVITVVDQNGPMTDQPLLMDRKISGLFSFTANLAPDLVSCETYVVRWTSMVDREVFTFGINLVGGGGNLAALEYDEAFVINMNGFQNPTSVAYQANVPQDFEVTVDMVAKKTSLSIDGVPVPEAQNLNFISFNAAGTFEYLIFSGSSVENWDFIIDDLQVIATCGSTPAIPTTWSLLKAKYRQGF
jgi:hypothetical protein